MLAGPSQSDCFAFLLHSEGAAALHQLQSKFCTQLFLQPSPVVGLFKCSHSLFLCDIPSPGHKRLCLRLPAPAGALQPAPALLALPSWVAADVMHKLLCSTSKTSSQPDLHGPSADRKSSSSLSEPRKGPLVLQSQKHSGFEHTLPK